MNGVKEELERAYNLLSQVTVSGDAVDLMAAARLHLRNAYAELADHETEGEDG